MNNECIYYNFELINLDLKNIYLLFYEIVVYTSKLSAQKLQSVKR